MRLRNTRVLLSGGLLLLTVALNVPTWADDSADAEKLLQSAQEAHANKDWPLATTRFREVVSKYGTTPSAAACKLGLVPRRVYGHDKNYGEAQKLLDGLKGTEPGLDAGKVVYYQGAVDRGLAAGEVAKAQATPKDADKHLQAAKLQFQQAAAHFAKARDAFVSKRAKAFEWTALAPCDLADIKLRLGA